MILSEVSIKRPIFITMVTMSLVIFGMICYNMIGVNLYPNADIPMVTIRTVLKGASPETVELKVSDKIEEAVNTISGVKEMNSTSLENVSIVVIEFELNKNIDIAATDVRDKVSSIMNELPADIDAPVIEKVDINASAIISMALSSSLPVRETTKIAKERVKEQLQKIDGVGSIKIIGGLERQIRVWLQNEKMLQYNITVDELVRALKMENIEVPGGKVEADGRDIVVKVKGEIEKFDEFKDLFIAYKNGYTVKLGDVARIEDGLEDRKNFARINGKPAVVLEVKKQSGTNTVKVADAIKASIARINKMLPEGTKVEVISDTSRFIKVSIEEVFFHLIFGGGLAIFIVFVFLRNIRMTLISAVALPTSVIGTFAFMKYMDFTFNTLTMLGLTISIGMLIDDAIVVIENIYRHNVEEKKNVRDAALEGTDEIGLAVLATTFSIVAVFVPVAFMKGIIGRFFYEFGMTVTFAVLISLFISFTITPMLCSRFMKNSESDNIISRMIGWVLSQIEKTYSVIVRASIKYRFIVVVLSLALLYLSYAIIPMLKSEFMPSEDRDQFSIAVETKTGSSLELTQKVMAYIENMIAKDSDILKVFSTIGADSQERSNFGNIIVELKPKKDRPSRPQSLIMAEYREKLKDFEHGIVAVQTASDFGSNGGRNSQIQYAIQGPDLQKLSEYSKTIMTEMAKVPGIVDIDTSFKEGKPEAKVYVDRASASKLMVPVSSIATTVKTLIGGENVSKFKDGRNQYDINVRLDIKERDTIGKLENIYVRSLNGSAIDFKAVARLEEGEGPTQINRTNRQRQVTVMANLDSKMATSEAMSAIDKIVAALKMPVEYSTKFSGASAMMNESFESIFFAMALAVVLIYMILASQFESLIHPITIMISLPLSVVGALGALLIFSKPVSVFSLIGIIMLMGLVTKNAILLIDYTLTLRGRGMNCHDAVAQAGITRLKPILMTTAAMIFGMLPIALGTGSGAETRGPMALCVIGGLLTSTALTLIVVPVIYTLFEDAAGYFAKRAVNEKIEPAVEKSPVF
ncbi:MAG TPA: efflux RND transporter permease subunit [Candidatus Wallbacteria bacterium]|nr:efflux RND transporter permease subunit [Candidatus Wallbacteria bacterium]